MSIRIPRITAEEWAHFERDCVEAARPVVLPGLVSGWPAGKLWTPDSLASRYGRRQVDVEVYPSGDYHDARGLCLRSMKLADYLGRASRPSLDGEERMYLTMKMPGALPELVHDIQTPAQVDAARLDFPTLFLGRDTASSCHLHARHHALLCMVSGTKTFELFPPEETPSLDPEPWYSPGFAFCRARPEAAAEQGRAPRLRRRATVELRAGDALFIPVHWWHWVRSPGFSIGVTYFWRAPFRDWSFPVPGRACLAALPVELGRRAVTRLRRSLVEWRPRDRR